MPRLIPTSLSRRVPVFIFILLLAVVGVASTAAYVELRALLVQMNEDRLASSTALVADLLSQQLGVTTDNLRSTADDAVAQLLTSGVAWESPPASAVLDDMALPASLRSLSLVAEDGACVGFVRAAAQGWSGDSGCAAAGEAVVGTELGVAPILVIGGAPRIVVMVPVDREDWVGRAVFMSDFQSEPGGGIIASLIADDAQLLLGNVDGGVWTDLASVAPGPPIFEGPGQAVMFESASGTRIGMATRIDGVPWVALAHRSLEAVLAPARAFLFWAVASGLLLTVLGSLGGWLVSRRITDRLTRLTEGAEAIAQGEYDLLVPIDRTDELGRLAAAFNTMTTKVDDRQHTLEDLVAERTNTLEEAMGRLEEAQEQLLRQERLATLGQLAGGVGHELRNPLGVMTNAVYYLEAVQVDGPSKVKDYMQILKEQISVSEKIISDLLDFGRVNSPERVEVDLEHLIEECLGRSPVGPEVRVHIEIPEGATRVHVDPGQMAQVLVNLLDNAVHAMGDAGGDITLRGCREGDEIVLRVSDTGSGIPEDQIDRIFEPLVTTKARGIGLGLAVSRLLASANGVAVSATSRLGEGATFVLRFPAEPPVGVA